MHFERRTYVKGRKRRDQFQNATQKASVYSGSIRFLKKGKVLKPLKISFKTYSFRVKTFRVRERQQLNVLPLHPDK